VTALIGAGLIGEYRLVVHPVAIGHGISLFAALRRPLRLDPVTARTFEGGTTLSVCRPQPPAQRPAGRPAGPAAGRRPSRQR
jgi:hypothetical protein